MKRMGRKEGREEKEKKTAMKRRKVAMKMEKGRHEEKGNKA